MTINELANMQGVELGRYDMRGLTWRQLGGIIGTAMSRNIMDRVLPRLLFSIGTIERLPKDRWACGEIPIWWQCVPRARKMTAYVLPISSGKI